MTSLGNKNIIAYDSNNNYAKGILTADGFGGTFWSQSNYTNGTSFNNIITSANIYTAIDKENEFTLSSSNTIGTSNNLIFNKGISVIDISGSESIYSFKDKLNPVLKLATKNDKLRILCDNKNTIYIFDERSSNYIYNNIKTIIGIDDINLNTNITNNIIYFNISTFTSKEYLNISNILFNFEENNKSMILNEINNKYIKSFRYNDIIYDVKKLSNLIDNNIYYRSSITNTVNVSKLNTITENIESVSKEDYLLTIDKTYKKADNLIKLSELENIYGDNLNNYVKTVDKLTDNLINIKDIDKINEKYINFTLIPKEYIQTINYELFNYIKEEDVNIPSIIYINKENIPAKYITNINELFNNNLSKFNDLDIIKDIYFNKSTINTITITTNDLITKKIELDNYIKIESLSNIKIEEIPNSIKSKNDYVNVNDITEKIINNDVFKLNTNILYNSNEYVVGLKDVISTIDLEWKNDNYIDISNISDSIKTSPYITDSSNIIKTNELIINDYLKTSDLQQSINTLENLGYIKNSNLPNIIEQLSNNYVYSCLNETLIGSNYITSNDVIFMDDFNITSNIPNNYIKNEELYSYISSSINFVNKDDFNININKFNENYINDISILTSNILETKNIEGKSVTFNKNVGNDDNIIEIVGSKINSCYTNEGVFIMNKAGYNTSNNVIMDISGEINIDKNINLSNTGIYFNNNTGIENNIEKKEILIYTNKNIMIKTTGEIEIKNVIINENDIKLSGSLNICEQGKFSSININEIGEKNDNTILQLSGSNDAYKPVGSLWNTAGDKRIKEDISDADIDKCYDNMKEIILLKFKYASEEAKLGFIGEEINTEQIIMTYIGGLQKMMKENESLELEIIELENNLNIIVEYFNEIKNILSN